MALYLVSEVVLGRHVGFDSKSIAAARSYVEQIPSMTRFGEGYKSDDFFIGFQSSMVHVIHPRSNMAFLGKLIEILQPQYFALDGLNSNKGLFHPISELESSLKQVGEISPSPRRAA